MNAQELYDKNGKPVGVWYCGKCKMLNQRGSSQADAERCCQPWLCECGKPVRQYYTKCAKCLAIHNAKRESDRMAKAALVDTVPDDCMVLDDDRGEYYDDVDGYLDCIDDPEDLNEYLYLAVFRPVIIGEAYELLDSSTDDHHEDIMDHMPDMADFHQAIEDVNKLFVEKKWGSYFPDYTRKIRVPKGGVK